MPQYNMDEGGIHQKFYLSRAPIQIFGGGFGNGKTAAACIKAITLARDYPGSNGLIARASYVKLNDTIRKEFYKWCPVSSVARWPTTTDNTLIFKNGSTINFRYIAQRGKSSADGQTTSNLLSATYDWVVVDQMEDPEISYKDFLDLQGRLRGSTPYKGDDPTMPMTGPRWFVGLCNPSANWVYSKIVKPLHRYKATGLVSDDLITDPVTKEPMIELIEGSTYENKNNLPADFITKLEGTYKGQMKKRFLLGEWAAYEGLVYPEFNLAIHMKPQMQLVDPLLKAFRSKNRYRGIQGLDVGIVVQSCYLIGYIDERGRIIIVDGFYEPGLTTDMLAERIKEMQHAYSYGIAFDEPMWADPAIFKQNQVNGKRVTTIAKILREDHEIRLAAAQNNIKSGIMKVSGYLSVRDGLGLDDESPGPGIVFADHLEFIADEFTAYFWKANDAGERIDEPVGRKDHAMDTIKYLLTKSPEASELDYRKPVLVPEIMKWQERRA